MASVKEVKDGKIWAFLAMFLGIVGFILVLLFKRKNKYANYYAKQSLVLFIASLIISWIPFVNIILGIVVFVLWIIGWVNALSGKEKPLPLIGQFADKFDL